VSAHLRGVMALAEDKRAALAAVRNGGRAAALTRVGPGNQTSAARWPSHVGRAERARRES
jgi:hypothetical protein